MGKKVGMTHLFGAEGRVVPVTVLEVGPCVVTQLRTGPLDGYEAVQVGYGEAKQLNKPAQGHLKRSSANARHLREFPSTNLSAHEVGQRLDVSQFTVGELVDVTATSKGRGFQGVMKRHGFHGGPKTHGQKDRQRAPGSIGSTTFLGRVVKGKKMAGHMGNRRVTTRKLRVQMVDPERNLLLVRGAVPGARNGLVMVNHTNMAAAIAAEAQLAETRLAEAQPEVPETPEVTEAVPEEPQAVVEQEAPAEEAPVAEAEAPTEKAQAPEAEASAAEGGSDDSDAGDADENAAEEPGGEEEKA